MLGTVISNLRLMASLVRTTMSNVTTLIQQSLSKIIGVLADLKTQFVALLNKSLQLALTILNIKRLRVSLIIVVELIKAELTTAKQKLTQIGLQLLTTVLKTLQLAKQVLLQSKDKLVAYIKLGQ